MRIAVVGVLLLLTFAGALWAEPGPVRQGLKYLWLGQYDPAQSLRTRIAPPAGYERPALKAGSFGDWLGHLPLKPGRPAVLLFDGTQKGNQEAHVAVLNMDVGNMPAQEMHLLRNPGDARGGPWYDADFGQELKTPQWTFLREHRKRF